MPHVILFFNSLYGCPRRNSFSKEYEAEGYFFSSIESTFVHLLLPENSAVAAARKEFEYVIKTIYSKSVCSKLHMSFYTPSTR